MSLNDHRQDALIWELQFERSVTILYAGNRSKDNTGWRSTFLIVSALELLTVFSSSSLLCRTDWRNHYLRYSPPSSAYTYAGRHASLIHMPASRFVFLGIRKEKKSTCFLEVASDNNTPERPPLLGHKIPRICGNRMGERRMSR